MGYLVLFALAVAAAYFLWTGPITAFYQGAIVVLGTSAERAVQFFQWSLWTTALGNLVVVSICLLVAGGLLFWVSTLLGRRLTKELTYDRQRQHQTVDHAVAGYKNPVTGPLQFKTGRSGFTLALRLGLLTITLVAAGFALVWHLGRGSLFEPQTLSVLGIGLAMTVFVAVSFQLDSRHKGDKK